MDRKKGRKNNISWIWCIPFLLKCSLLFCSSQKRKIKWKHEMEMRKKIRTHFYLIWGICVCVSMSMHLCKWQGKDEIIAKFCGTFDCNSEVQTQKEPTNHSSQEASRQTRINEPNVRIHIHTHLAMGFLTNVQMKFRITEEWPHSYITRIICPSRLLLHTFTPLSAAMWNTSP